MADLNDAVAELTANLNALIVALQPILTGTAPLPTVTFANTPGTFKATELIDYSSRTGTALYQDGVRSLYDDETKFDLNNERVMNFIDKVKARAEKMGWNNATQGITTYQVDGQDVDLIEHYGLIDITEIQDQSKPWYEHDGAKVNQRAAQNNTQFFEMLMNSLSETSIDAVKVYENEYMLDDNSGTNKLVGNAAALYKVIMRCTVLDTKATNKALRDRLKDLPTVVTTVNGDIDAIHSHFTVNYNQLRARGADMDDKEELLFAAYSNVPDYRFRKYMDDRETDYFDSRGDMAGKDYRFIMQLAKQKYDTLLKDTHYKWGTPSPAEQQVIALHAELTEVKSENLQISKQLKAKLKDPKGKDKKGKDKKDAGGGPKTKNKKDTSNKTRQKKDEAWKKVAPKANEPKTKEQGGKKWNWCEHHQAWCIHHPTDCDLAKKLRASTTQATSNQANQAETSTNNFTANYAQLLAHLATLSTE